MNDFGVNFAPTTDASANGPRNGQLSGVPQAIQILSLALPKMGSARGIAPPPLLNAPGASGMDPASLALFHTIMKTLGLHAAMGMPGGTAGPNQLPWETRPTPGDPQTGNPTLPAMPSMPSLPAMPHVVAQPAPTEPRVPFRTPSDNGLGFVRGGVGQ